MDCWVAGASSIVTLELGFFVVVFLPSLERVMSVDVFDSLTEVEFDETSTAEGFDFEYLVDLDLFSTESRRESETVLDMEFLLDSLRSPPPILFF